MGVGGDGAHLTVYQSSALIGFMLQSCHFSFSLGGNLEEFTSRANQTGRMSASEAKKKKRKDEWDRKI